MMLLHIALYKDSAFCTNVTISTFNVCTISTHFASTFVLMQNASTLPTHFVTKNQNVQIVILVQNALYQ